MERGIYDREDRLRRLLRVLRRERLVVDVLVFDRLCERDEDDLDDDFPLLGLQLPFAPGFLPGVGS